MQDAMNTLMLICAILASMAFGVLAAYWICRASFAILRVHARSVAVIQPQHKPQVARLT
jgi:membrane protein DedA with SNARE-associated domain